MGGSDAKWIVALYYHQDRCEVTSELPAVVYKVAIDLLTDSLYPELTADPTLIESEKAHRDADRALVAKYLGARPLPCPESRNYKGFIAGDSGCQ
eukprot:3377294-Heterocapsa_arctica.AAC.1